MFWVDFEQIENNIALITHDECLTYCDVKRLSNQIGSYITKKSLVFILCRNNIESILSYISTMENHSVPLLLNDNISKEALDRLIDIYKPRYIFCEQNRELDRGKVLWIFRNYMLVNIQDTCNYVLNNELSLLLSTSGSTGSSKLVRLSCSNVVNNANAIANFLGITSHDTTITTLPMSYTYGLSIINSHLVRGAAIVLTDFSMLKQEFWNLFFDNNVCSFGGVPFIYEILKQIKFWDKHFEKMRYMTVSGGRMASELLDYTINQCVKKNIQFYQMYGQTEATARISYLPYNFAASKKGSIGKSIEGGRLWVEDDKGVTINKPFSVGNLLYEGKNVFLGYANALADLSKGDENGGVLKTGDLAYFDNDGFFYLKGRKNRILKIYGIRIHLDELEELLDKHGFTCACAGVDDSLSIFTTREGDIKQIEEFITHMVDIPKAGYRCIYVDRFPRKDSGKIDYEHLIKCAFCKKACK